MLHASEAFICKALKGEVIPLQAGFRALKNEEDGSLRCARGVKINEIDWVILLLLTWYLALLLQTSRPVGA